MSTKNNNLVIGILVLIIIGAFYYVHHENTVVVVPVQTTTGDTGDVLTPTSTNSGDTGQTNTSSVTYTNNQYGFNFTLPTDWNGYSVVTNTWSGNPLNSSTSAQTGPKLLLRNPNWTDSNHYEDIPVLVFTLAQWNSYVAGNFAVSAAPIAASELGRNNTYVFALPPRWDFDYSTGYQEADTIVQSNPLQAFNI